MYTNIPQPRGRRIVSGGAVQFWQPSVLPPRRASSGLGADLSTFLSPKLSLLDPTAIDGGYRPLSSAPQTTAAAGAQTNNGGILGWLGRGAGNIFNFGADVVNSAGSFSEGYRDATGKAPPKIPIGQVATLLDKAKQAIGQKSQPQPGSAISVPPAPAGARQPNWVLIGGAVVVAGVGAYLLMRGRGRG